MMVGVLLKTVSSARGCLFFSGKSCGFPLDFAVKTGGLDCSFSFAVEKRLFLQGLFHNVYRVDHL